MADGITVKILGDYGPFSRVGKSIGYQITIGQSNYLIDCGAPLFQQIGGHILKNINGLIITHCHDDHKRWYSDMALFNMYAPDVYTKVVLFTTEEINDELIAASAPALDRSLSIDSKTIIDIPYDDYVKLNLIGPRARYKIVSEIESPGKISYCIKDEKSNLVDTDIAKIIINPKTKRPRMLFKDPNYNEWVEPESFYPFSSKIFYEDAQNTYRDKEGFTIQAIKAPVWHGIPGIGLKISTDKETLVFSSDTVHDKELWAALYTEKRTQKLTMPQKAFESAAILYGDINDYIERIWSEERYVNAKNAFDGSVVIHDVSARKSVVHTDYEKLSNSFLKKEKTLLTHSPDRMTSEWVLCNSGKTFTVRDNKFYEFVDGELFPMDAEIYHKEDGRYFAGYKNDKGEYLVYEKDGLLGIAHVDTKSPKYGLLDMAQQETVNIDIGTFLYRVDLYEDISGRYFPVSNDKNTVLYERKDGKVERIEFNENSSIGKVVENCREKVSKK